MLKRRLMTVLVILLIAVSNIYSTIIGYAKAPKQIAYTNKIEAFIQTQMQEYKIPGMAIAIVRNGEVEYLEGFGVANPDGELITPDTPFLLASVSKSMTAVAVMQLIEDGKLSLDDPVQKHLPWFTVSGSVNEEITVADLLYQASGFSELDGLHMNLRPDRADELEAGVRDLARVSLNFSPGNGWEYSNINFNVLGLLVQEISGQSYESYIQENIFVPLGMTNSHTSLTGARAAHATSGYYSFFGIPLVYDEYMPYTSATLPAGGIWSSVSDMSRYLIAHLDEESSTLLSAEGMAQLHTPGVEIEPGYNYAMGWFHAPNVLDPDFLQTLNTDLNPSDDLQVLWHQGEWANYKSIALLLPKLEYGVILLINMNDPTITSVFKDFAWDVTLIANGGNAYYFQPSEDFQRRHARLIFSGLPLLLLGGLLWYSRKWKQFPSERIHWITWLPLLINLVLLAYLYLKFLPDNSANAEILLGFAPDLGILLILVTILSISWVLVSGLSLAKVLSK